MNHKPKRFLTVILLAGLLLALALGASTALSQGEGQSTPRPDALTQAIRHGKWPAQVAAHSGAIRPDRHGPQRNDPAEGIPKHAYSPFAERVNRDYPCPPGGCDFQKGRVVVKLAPRVRVREPGKHGLWTESRALNEALSAQGVTRLEPVFPHATPPRPGAFVVSPNGDRLPEPDLTRWYRAV
jgi:hypothetical protein